MAATLSDSGLLFISSWSVYSSSPYKVERNYSYSREFLGFFNGDIYSNILSPEDTTEKLTTTEDEALTHLRSNLTNLIFNLVTDFGFEKFNQTQFDSIVSLLTPDALTDDYYDHFKNTELYTVLKTDVSDSSVPNLITNYTGNVPFSRSGAFYDLSDRRSAESTLFSSGVYNNCSNLTTNEKVVDGVKVLY